MRRFTLAILLAASPLPFADSALALTDAEIDAIVDSVVPDYPVYRADPAQCPPGATVIDQRGQITTTGGRIGISIPKPPVCLVGADVRSTWDDDLPWQEVKNRALGDDFIKIDSGPGRATILGTRTHGGADPIAPPKSPDTSREMTLDIRHVYARHTRDDFLENDSCLDARITDTLVDGTWVFVSARPGAGNQDAISRPATHTVERTLVHGACQADPRTRNDTCPPGESNYQLFKLSSCAGQFHIKDAIFRVDSNPGKGTGDFPPGSYDNVWFVWLGQGSYKGSVPSSVNVVTGEDGLKLWNRAREKWLVQHGCDLAGDSCSMTEISDESPPPPPDPEPTPEPEPAISGLPATLSASSPEATVALDLDVPDGASEAVVTLTVHDADSVAEGSMEINGNVFGELFGTVVQGAGNNNLVVDLEYTVPADWFQDGQNLITFRHLTSAGYRVEGVAVEFLIEDVPPTEPTVDQLLARIADLEAENALLDSELTDAYETIDDLESGSALLETELAEALGAADALEAQNSLLQTELAEALGAVDVLDQALAAARAVIDQAVGQAETLLQTLLSHSG